jgi:hypothetical protein
MTRRRTPPRDSKGRFRKTNRAAPKRRRSRRR